MFRGVRDWWQSGRGRSTARLFLFEFVVVMVGVLAAQALQNWASRREAVSVMEEARSRSLRQLADSFAYARSWEAAMPCLQERMDELMRVAGSGSIDAATLQRPAMPTFIQEELDDRSDLLLRQRYGNAVADRMKSMREDLAFANRSVDRIVGDWGRLRLIDVRLGAPSEADRSAARAAAADISAELVALRFALTHFMAVAKAAGIPAKSADRFRPARQCQEIWRNRSLAIAP
jgi:hypothetical protein